MKTIVFFFFVLTFTVSSTCKAFSASPDEQINDHEARIQRLECQQHIDANVVSNSGHGCLASGFSLEGEFLWWRAHIDNLEFALDLDTAVNPTIGKGDFYQPNFQYDPGVRVSAGYDFGRQNWDIALRWTYHNTDASNGISIDPNVAILTPLRDYFAPHGLVSLTTADSASAKWKNHINVLDFEMGYDYFISHRFSLRPFMGVKAAWIHMDYDIRYTDVIASSFIFGPVSLGTVDIKNRSDFWGVGPQVGTNGYLHIGWGFSLYGITSVALLYGQYDTSFRQTDTTVGNDLKIYEKNYFRQRMMVQVVLGAEWAKCFSDSYLLSLHIGWGGQYWLNQLEYHYLNDDIKPTGDLTYTGLDVGARFEF